MGITSCSTGVPTCIDSGNKPDLTGCSDGDNCSYGDVCRNGVCLAGSQVQLLPRDSARAARCATGREAASPPTCRTDRAVAIRMTAAAARAAPSGTCQSGTCHYKTLLQPASLLLPLRRHGDQLSEDLAAVSSATRAPRSRGQSRCRRRWSWIARSSSSSATTRRARSCSRGASSTRRSKRETPHPYPLIHLAASRGEGIRATASAGAGAGRVRGRSGRVPTRAEWHTAWRA